MFLNQAFPITHYWGPIICLLLFLVVQNLVQNHLPQHPPSPFLILAGFYAFAQQLDSGVDKEVHKLPLEGSYINFDQPEQLIFIHVNEREKSQCHFPPCKYFWPELKDNLPDFLLRGLRHQLNASLYSTLNLHVS